MSIVRKCNWKTCHNLLADHQKQFCSRSCQSKAANTGRKLTKKHKQAIKYYWNNLTDEQKKLRMNRWNLMIKIPWSQQHKNNLSKSLKSSVKLKEVIKKRSKNLEWKHKISEANRKRIYSDETKRKIREAVVNRIKKLGYFGIGINETKMLNEQETKDNCKIQRQMHIKGLGYIVDGYCKETNTVYEVYEKYHEKQVEHDLQRQEEIQKNLGCKFIAIKD